MAATASNPAARSLLALALFAVIQPETSSLHRPCKVALGKFTAPFDDRPPIWSAWNEVT